MPTHRHVFTSESVTEGHPDKIADQISDAVLDAILVEDPNARVACETLVTTGMAVVAGEITTSTYVHIPDIVRGTITSIGYTDANFGFDAQTCAVLTTIDRQSADIAMGVDKGGAGDQGMMFGYATDETPSLMPLPIMIAHRLAERLATVRKSGDFPWLRPDGKTQVSVTYEGSKPIGIDTIVVSAQHSDMIDNTQLRAGILAHVVRPVVHEAGFEVNDKLVLVNPTGRFVVGGPQGDAGLTGRKIIVDSYGGMALGGQEHRRGRAREALRGTSRLCDRRGGARLDHGRHIRDRNRAPGRTGSGGPRSLRSHAWGHHPGIEPAQSDLSAHRGLRPLRPGARAAEGRRA
jgi:S-adenosylmethionine synthetase